MELLKKLYEIHSPSGCEKKIKRFIRTYIAENIDDAQIVDNRDGNIYVVKGESDTYPCVVAHLDQVQKVHSEDFIAVETDDIIFGYSPKNRQREGLGADDKNGLWIGLKCLEEFDAIKIAFFVGEEIGCVGSGKCNMAFFNDCRFIIEPDRKGSSDLITSIYGKICSNKFKEDICPQLFGYEATSGLMTDVIELCERGVGLSCINLSCGYYEPHTSDEFTVKEDLLNCLAFVRHIIETCTDVYPHKYEDSYSNSYGTTYRYSGYSSSHYSGYSHDYDDYDRGWYSKRCGIKILHAREFADLESFVDQLMYENIGYEPEELWPYVSSDLETFGVTEDQFLNMAYQLWWNYNEGWYEQQYGATYARDFEE